MLGLMQAVILAAGVGKRMLPLTLTRPKPLVEVGGKPIIEHVIDALPSEIDDIIIVVGYKAEMIQERLGKSYGGRKIRYVVQEKPEGTAHALRLAEPFLKGRFFFMFADDLHGKEDLKEALKHDLAILAAEHVDPSRFGVIEVKKDGTLANILEKPDQPTSNLVSTGAMVLDERIFNYSVERHESGEYYLTPALARLAAEHSVAVVKQGFWVPLATPEDVLNAEKVLKRHSIE